MRNEILTFEEYHAHIKSVGFEILKEITLRGKNEN